jgi:hypothetical protein
MSVDRDRICSDTDFSTSIATIRDEDEFVVLDFMGPRWELVEHRPDRKRRARGGDPYNTAEPPKLSQAWLRIERR